MAETYLVNGTIDLSRLPKPDIFPQVEFEQLLAARKTALLNLLPVELRESVALTLELESEPLLKLLQESAYRELLIRQDGNDQGQGLLLAFAGGPQLDHIGITYYRLPRLPDEGDDAYRTRLLLAPEGRTTAGSEGAYELAALSAHTDVKSVRIESPAPVDVSVYVLSRQGDGTPSADLLTAVSEKLSAKDVRPLTDRVTVYPASILPYTVTAELFLYREPGGDITLARSDADLRAYLSAAHRLNGQVVESGVHAALTNAGVHEVRLTGWSDVIAGPHEAPWCTAINITLGGYVDD